MTETTERNLLFVMKPMESDFFTEVVHRVGPGVSVSTAATGQALSSIYSTLPRSTRLIAFSTNVIVPRSVLEHFRHNCINFHPGPPNYPGYRPTGFALYRGERLFGVTAHYMVERVDEGTIIAAETFGIAPDAALLEVVRDSYARLARLFVGLAPRLIDTGRPLPAAGVSWSGRKTSRADYEAMRRVGRGVSEDELALRLRCFDGVYTPLD